MDYELLHKEISVAVLGLSAKMGVTVVDTFTEVLAHDHMTIGTTQPNSLKCKPENF
jgi:hypothetical protein